MIFDWFNAQEVVAFAETVATDISKMVPLVPQKIKARTGKKSRNDLDDLVYRVRSFAKKNPLNVYKKAKFLNVIKWKLRESGYDEAFISEVVVMFTAAMST